MEVFGSGNARRYLHSFVFTGQHLLLYFYIMSKNASELSKLTETQKERLLIALIELSDGEPSMLLQDVVGLYFMALESNLMNAPEHREAKTFTFLHLHNFLSKLDMILNHKQECYQLAV